MKLTMLIDNRGDESLFCTEWGLSVLIEYRGKRILLDTGASGQFAENAKRLGVDLSKVDLGVLSHAHYDHADGMETFFELNDHAPFYVQAGSEENCYGLKDDGSVKYIGIRQGVLSKYADRIRFVDGVTELMPGVWVVPHARKDYTAISKRSGLYEMIRGTLTWDRFFHEQSLVFETERGLVVMSSCSHTGIENILSEVRAALPGWKVRALVGGLHLYKLSDEEVAQTAERIREEEIEKVLTGHCTGERPYEVLVGLLPGKVERFETGEVRTFG